MAERAAVIANLGGGTVRITWAGLLAGDTGESVNMGIFGVNRSVHIYGTFGGATAVLQVRGNASANWQSATDPQGNAISKGAEALEEIEESTGGLRPALTGGDGTTALTCVVEARR